MKTMRIILVVIVVVAIAACTASKKVSTPLTAAPSPVPSTPMVLLKPTTGFYAPGNEELAAIQVQYKDATLEQLHAGYKLYTQGACVMCHNAENIYRFSEIQWKNIIDDMAGRASLNPVEKDAVYKYVLSIKAAKPKDATCKQ